MLSPGVSTAKLISCGLHTRIFKKWNWNSVKSYIFYSIATTALSREQILYLFLSLRFSYRCLDLQWEKFGEPIAIESHGLQLLRNIFGGGIKKIQRNKPQKPKPKQMSKLFSLFYLLFM